ncbi:MAG: hypothetical protein KIT25_25680 [Enhydrobacter sp.]|nr:MAG: hypothetical protein KIT25_25680 [Enhydrobacter sp.]
MRKHLCIVSAAIVLAQMPSPAVAQNAAHYMAYKSADSAYWSAFTDQAHCEKSAHGPRQCVPHVFCGATYWFPQVSFDGEYRFSTSDVASINERTSERVVCKVK